MQRRTLDMDRAQERCASDAVRKGVAAWPLDVELLYELRAKGVTMVGIQNTDSGDLWLTTLDRFFDLEVARNGLHRGQSVRSLPLNQFKYRPGRTKL
jgi:hypothetical protein